MTKKKPQALSFLDSEIKELDSMKVYHLDIEKGKSLKYYPKFAENKIDEVLEELILSIAECKKNNIELLTNDDEILKYAHYLIIKHFTDMKDYLSEKDIYENIAYLDKFYKIGWFDLFIGDMFDEVEIQKVIDKVYKMAEFSKKHEKELAKKIQLIEQNVKNETLKKKALDKLK